MRVLGGIAKSEGEHGMRDPRVAGWAARVSKVEPEAKAVTAGAVTTGLWTSDAAVFQGEWQGEFFRLEGGSGAPQR